MAWRTIIRAIRKSVSTQPCRFWLHAQCHKKKGLATLGLWDRNSERMSHHVAENHRENEPPMALGVAVTSGEGLMIVLPSKPNHISFAKKSVKTKEKIQSSYHMISRNLHDIVVVPTQTEPSSAAHTERRDSNQRTRDLSQKMRQTTRDLSPWFVAFYGSMATKWAKLEILLDECEELLRWMKDIEHFVIQKWVLICWSHYTAVKSIANRQ